MKNWLKPCINNLSFWYTPRKTNPKLRLNNFPFWKEHPALFFSLSILIGTSAPLFFGHYLWPLLWLAYIAICNTRVLLPQTLLLIASIFYGHLHQIPPQPQEVSAIFYPQALVPHSSPFQQGLQYKGTIVHEGQSLPCTIYFREPKETHPLADKNYIVQGTLQQRGPADFTLKVKEWKAIPYSWSLAELRYQTKEKFKKLLATHLSSPRVATLLSSITTGDVEDRSLRYEFGRVGLQHILAISGFHFGILIAFLTYFLRLFLTRTWKILILFLLTTAYYIFVGPSPAVERSYLTALFYLIGMWTNRTTSGLNLLGMAMGTELIFNPHIASNMGFQLSFLSCFAILLFYAPLEQWMQKLLPQRNWSEIQSLTLLSRHGHLISSFLKKAISLNLAVNVALLPIILFHFHQFPLLGLLYNIFFPFCLGGSLFLLLCSLLFHMLFPPLAYPLFWITNQWTDFLLKVVFNPPLAIDYSLQFATVPITFIILYLFLLTFWRISQESPSRGEWVIPAVNSSRE